MNTCQNCKWWKTTTKNEGICYFNPPIPGFQPIVHKFTGQVGMQSLSHRPVTKGDDYCGRFQIGLVTQ